MTTTTTGGRPPRPRTPTPAGAARLADRLAQWETPATSYYLLLGATLLLVVFGLVMVLSSSSVTAMAAGGSAFSVVARQALFAAIGLPLMFAASRVTVATWKRLAWPALALAVFGQLLVFTPLGKNVNGNTNWIEVAGFTAQPSEAAKWALVLWCAAVLSRKVSLLDRWKHAVVPVAPLAGLLIGMVMLGHDLGTAVIMMVVVGVMLFVAGAPLRLFGIGALAAGAVATLMVLSSENRVRRIQSWFSGECVDQFGSCWQSQHGTWALASGGWWGLGLGASREKWSWLPAAHNDFIYAIIGEELGLPGTLVVLALFVTLSVAFVRVVRRHDDPFVKIATAGVLAWVVGQALANVAVVLGLVPVVGVPLPLVSSGGSALISCLLALGMVMSFARAEPGADEALTARAAVVRHSLAVVGARASAARGAAPAYRRSRPRR